MKLLLTGALGADELRLDEIRALGYDVLYVQDERGPLPDEAYAVDGVVCNALFVHHPVDRFPNLRFVQLTSAGLDRVPVAELERRGVTVFNAAGVYAIPVAESAVMQVLQLAKKSRVFMRNQEDRVWEKSRDLRELAGLTACVVGFGEVGREVAKRLRGFDMRVIAVRRNPEATPLTDDVVALDDLTEAVSRADVVVIALALTPGTHHLIDECVIGAMKPDALLVNVARGQIIDESALIVALERGHLGGVALDVVDQEPLAVESPLWGFERVIITPHNAYASARVTDRLFDVVLANARALAPIGAS